MPPLNLSAVLRVHIFKFICQVVEKKMAPSAVVRAAVKVIVSEIAKNLIVKLKHKKNRKKRVWIRDWIRRRSILGGSERLLKEISTEDPNSYRNFMRLYILYYYRLYIYYIYINRF